MRTKRFLLLCLLAAVCRPAAFGAAVRWTGEGATAKASDGMNWSTDRAPGGNDYALFGKRSSKDCDWDLNVALSSFAMTTAYKGSVRLQASKLEVAGSVNVEGGKLDLRDGSLTAGRGLFVGFGGALELSNGTLSVCPEGILVDRGGTFLSTGHSPARVRPAQPGEYYKFIVGRGNVTLSNPAGTEVDGSRGITIYSRAQVGQADFVKIKRLKPGGTALRVFRAEGQQLDLKGWTFDETVEEKTIRLDAWLERSELEGKAVELRTPEDDRPAPHTKAPAAEKTEEAPFEGLTEYEDAVSQVNIQPYLAVQFNGGQYFFKGEKGNLSGNLNVLGSMVIRHEKLARWTLVPVLSSQYQGTKQVADLVGGGTLFQERMSHSLAVRGIYQLTSKWKLKPGVGYKWEFLKETRDESWGNGLFDYRRPGFSLEGEYAYKDPFTFRIGYDFYRIGFVNFASLESLIKDSQGNAMARELAGRSVLDSTNHSLTFGGTMQGPWRTYAEGNLVTTLRLFPDQHVVNRAGDFRNSTRADFANQLYLAWRLPRELSGSWKAVSGVKLSAGYNKSNQNSYDAQRLRFLKDYYDSTSLRAGVELSLYRKLKEERPLELNLSVSLGRVGYQGRVAQNSSGLYLSDNIYQNEAVLGLGVSYPIAPHFVWTSQFGYGRQTSNQNFERLYSYNFTTTNYRLGFGYEY